MKATRVLLWVAVALVLAVGGLIVYLSVADLGWLKPRVEKIVSNATGREFRIESTFSLRALWHPSLVLEDANLANAPWGAEADLAHIGHLAVDVDLVSLISGPIRITNIEARDVSLSIEQDAEGRSNFDFGTGEEAPEDSSEPDDTLPLIVEHAQVRDVRVQKLAPDAKPFVAVVERLDIATATDEWLDIQGAGTVNDLPFRIEGRTGTIAALQKARDIGLDLAGGLGDVELVAKGTLARLGSIAGSNLAIQAQSKDVAPVLERLGIDLDLEGVLDVDANIETADEKTQVEFDAKAGQLAARGTANFPSRQRVIFEATLPKWHQSAEALGVPGLPPGDLDLAGDVAFERSAYVIDSISAQLGDTQIAASGTVSRDRRHPDEISIEAQVASLAALREGLPAQPLEATAKIKRESGRVTLDPFSAKLADSDLKGSLAFEPGEHPVVEAQLASERIDLRPYTEPEEEEQSGAEGKQPGKEKKEYLFAREPLPLDWLRKADIDVDVAIASLIMQSSARLDDVSVQARLEDGHFTGQTRSVAPAGGVSTSQLEMTSTDSGADVKLKTEIADFKLNLFSGEDATPEDIPPIGVEIDLAASGDSPHALAASADGRVIFTQGAGRTDNKLLSRFSGDIISQLLNALNPFVKSEPYSNWECTVFGLDLKNGQGEITGMLAQSEKVTIVGGGDIDLDKEKLSIEFNTKPRKGVGVSADMFVTPFVQLTGTLAEPRVGLNKKGILLAGGAAVATGGISLLVQGFMDRVTGEQDRCAKMREEVSTAD
jgi:uncharacterized protein involved in outer membrane biogenesis